MKQMHALSRPRILLVEDEILIGIEIAEMLKNTGFEIFGLVNTVGSAIDLLQNHSCDAAVLDINLGRETSEPVAKLLVERGTPFLSVSGRNLEDRPQAFSGSPHLSKPIQPALLIKMLRQLIEATAHEESS